ncbi:hypothetical protein [Photobacterium sanguinicancri]|uniref:hypothetical protein n=1 Tax=Photobacterium sanguinicancri TaxID=875932 RepID=UPI0026E1D460|nr:hypothetical protein [Photobacterium sanguinicancri]MDO6496790.1 hypothetical protein [Photobacterium sanguinicancri]
MKKFRILSICTLTVFLAACNGSSDSDGDNTPPKPTTGDMAISSVDEFNQEVLSKGVIDANQTVTVTLPSNNNTLVIKKDLTVKGNLVIK